MGEKDTLTKRFMSRPEVFADAFNYLIYDGEPVIDPENLRELDTASIALPYAGDSKTSIQKTRDVLKEWVCMKDDKAAYMILGVENQSNIHYAMPVRNMLYDAVQYENQVKNAEKSNKTKKAAKSGERANDKDGEYMSGFAKGDRLKPVVTLVIYFGDKEWDAPVSIYDMLDTPDDKMLAFVADYKINLICPFTMSEAKLEKMKSIFKEAMLFIKYSNNPEKFDEIVDHNPLFRHMDYDTAAMLNEVTGSEMTITEGKETVDMCLAMQAREERGVVKGRALGILGTVEILRSLDLPDEEILDKIKAQYQLTDDEAGEYMNKAET